MKCVRDGLLSGIVDLEHIRTAHGEDNSALALKVMPKITAAHVNPSSFSRMRVNLAFHLLSPQNKITMRNGGGPAPTEAFLLPMWKLVHAMTARMPLEGLKPGSTQESH